jgi:hypothetical protein
LPSQTDLGRKGTAEGDVIHSESGICVHTGGQLRCGGRFGGGAGAAKVRTAARRPTGGAEDDAEDDEIAELGVAAVPLATRVAGAAERPPISSAFARATPAERGQATGLRYGGGPA